MARTRKPSGLPDKGKKRGRRPNDALPESLRFLIVCEGKRTEKHYFERFKANVKVHSIRVEGIGVDALGVVEAALVIARQDSREGREGYDQVWCVFDRDSLSAERFNGALDEVQRNGFYVAYSNQAFELWYWLHFDYQHTGISRVDYGAKLTERLGFSYKKNDLRMYDHLLPRQPEAIRNAQRLLDAYASNHNPERDNPCTTVHLLVQELNRHAR
jgi:hypothetical protein